MGAIPIHASSYLTKSIPCSANKGFARQLVDYKLGASSHISMSEAEQATKDRDLLLGYSCDVITSYSLVKDYDPRQIAFAIDRIFGEHGLINDIQFQNLIKSKTGM